MKFLLALIVGVSVVAATVSPAQAYIMRLAVVNDSDTCALVTVWEERRERPFVQLGPPHLLKPRMDVDYPMAGGSDRSSTAVRVRAEMKANADCSGRTVSDLEQPERSARPNSEYLEAVLLGRNGGYRIKY